ncbi:MAG: iron-containing alcohol dehydrogenase [Oscillospiraceae bacterium]
MNNFDLYLNTHVFFGREAASNIPQNINCYGNRVLMVYGGGSIFKNGVYEEVTTILQNGGIEYIELGGIDPNPRIASVREGAKICKENNIDVVLAVGGGSTVDCAKAIAAAACYSGDAWDLVLDKSKVTKALPIFVVLTVAATGSEMDCGAVISNPETKDKYDFDSPWMRPSCAFMDPTHTFTVPKKQTAAGTVDIMSHVLEAYFSRAQGFMQDRIAEALLKTCIVNGNVALDNPTDYDARANLMWASSWAINGLTSCGKGQAWSVHQIEHMLSGYYDITHGVGLAILTPVWMEYVLDESSVDKFAEYAKNVWDVDDNDKWNAAREGIRKTRECFTSWGMPTKLSELDIDDRYFGDMAQKAAVRGLDSAYKPLFEEDIVNILKRSL